MLVGHPVVWILVAAVLAPLLAEIPIGFKVPVVVLEVALGIVLHPGPRRDNRQQRWVLAHGGSRCLRCGKLTGCFHRFQCPLPASQNVGSGSFPISANQSFA